MRWATPRREHRENSQDEHSATDPVCTEMITGKSKHVERHDIDDELSTSGAQELLTSASAAHLAYIGKDGTPRVIPVGFWWTGDQVVISTATTSPKVTALSARPDVALSIDAGDTPEQARALSIRGRASVQIVDGVVEEYLAAARRTMDADAAAEFEQNCREMYDQMARIAITPYWVRYYEFGAGRVPRFLQELAERNRS
jgi:nitroimidazol reductase NimA-like FMN-containing flavoprotein (pyridoxamine 5'-phosphate oxidase superfamily)